MKAAIYGSYSYGNYGDDVMAIQFAIHLQKLDYEVSVYRLDEKLAEQYDIKSVQTFDELFKDASFCIIGGGGFLVDNLTDSVDREFAQLLEKSVQYDCPVFPISIGGEGKGADAKLSKGRRLFFGNSICQSATVRLAGDVDLFEKLGNKARYYPDVLLSVAKFWEIDRAERKDNYLKVGINLPKSTSMKLFLAELKLISIIRKDIIFYFIPTYLPDSSVDWEFLPKKESASIKIHHYIDPQSTLNFLASLDLVISYKLHLGLTALALGTPFYSVGGPGKVGAFLKEIGAEFAVRPASDKLFNLAMLLSNPEGVYSLRQRYDFEKLKVLQDESWGHLEQLTNIAGQMKQRQQHYA